MFTPGGFTSALAYGVRHKEATDGPRLLSPDTLEGENTTVLLDFSFLQTAHQSVTKSC